MNLINCLICDTPVTEFCNLGDQYPANSLEKIDTYPLAAAYCRKCYHVQLTYCVSRELLFDNYTYISGVSQRLRDYWKKLKYYILQHSQPCGHDILDIAANDGSFLEEWDGWNCVGVEPCKRISDLCNNPKIRFENTYFPNHSINEKFDIITAFNVLGHVANPIHFIKECSNLLKYSGSIWVLTSQADMVVTGQFDTIYHEHLSYFSAKSFQSLADQCGLKILSISKSDIHGGSYLVQLGKCGSNYNPLILNEASTGRYTTVPYKLFSKKKDLVVKNVQDFCTRHHTTIGLGASAKGSVVMQTAKISPTAIFDENPIKVGKSFPNGTPIVNKDGLPASKSHWGVIDFTWNFRDELWGKLQSHVNGNNIHGEILDYFPNFSIEMF